MHFCTSVSGYGQLNRDRIELTNGEVVVGVLDRGEGLTVTGSGPS